MGYAVRIIPSEDSRRCNESGLAGHRKLAWQRIIVCKAWVDLNARLSYDNPASDLPSDHCFS